MKLVNTCVAAFQMLVLLPPVVAAPLMIEEQRDCHVLGDVIKDDKLKQLTTPMSDITSRHDLLNTFSGGKSGAHVALVYDRALHEYKVLKIFPTIKKSHNKYNFREPYYTCINGFINYADVGIAIDPAPLSSNVFPRLYEFGMTNGAEFGATTNSFSYPYMLFEFVTGMPLSSVGKAAARHISLSGGFQLYHKGERAIVRQNKHQSDAMLYQIAHLLYSLKHMRIDDQKYRFYHADLNSGNIMVKQMASSVTMDAGFGAIHFTDVPLITFIDFGHSTSNLDENLGSKVLSIKTVYHQKMHFFSASTEGFYRNLTGERLSKLEELVIGLRETNSDRRLYRLMARAIYDSGNFYNRPFSAFLTSCRSTTTCVSLAPSFFKDAVIH